MAPPNRAEAIEIEGRIALAIKAIQNNQISTEYEASKVYNVPRMTLRRRLHGKPPRLGSRSKFRLLSEFEETVLIQWIQSMERRGFPPFIIDVNRMAQRLIDSRGDKSPKVIGKQWIYKFLKQHPQLDTRLARSYDSQRARNEDPKIITEWFNRVQQIRQQYGIEDRDIFNFDETGFAMGIAHSGASKAVVVDTVGRATVIQPGDRRWTTVIECINASGWALPPLIILEGKVHLEAWYRDNSQLPGNWAIHVSDNGWTTDEIGLKWIQHFDKYTKSQTIGVYRLLILDGHGSHSTPEFDQYCTDNQIITLCMPPHSSHLLQPLDVACFSPLKAAYSRLISNLVRQGQFHLDKTDFLGNYQKVRPSIHSELNILAGFRATGLVPSNPDRVLSNLTITKTPSPPPHSPLQPSSPWISETPRNTHQISKQMELIQDVIQDSVNLIAPIAKLAKSASIAWNMLTLSNQKNSELEATNTYLQTKAKRTKKQLQRGGVLEVQQAQQLILDRDNAIQQAEVQRAQQPLRRAPPTCSSCHVQGHTIRQCTNIQLARLADEPN
jgi:hypothetical protein